MSIKTAESDSLIKQVDQATIIEILVIIIVGWLIITGTQRFVPWLVNHARSTRLRIFLQGLLPITRLLVIIISLFLIISRLIEPSFENLIAFFGAMALALGFAFKDYISSLIAGVVTLYEVPYRPGDWIEVEGAYGKLRAINLRNIEIVTPGDTVVYIPHVKIWTELVFNANDGGPNLQTETFFYLDPNHNTAQVKNALYNVALTSPLLKSDQPIVIVVRNKPWATQYLIRAYPVQIDQQFLFVTDLTIRGKEVLRALGVEFAVTQTALNPDK